MDPEREIKPRTWKNKFADAIRGVRIASREQSSFIVHKVVAGAVLICGFIFQVSRWEWCILLLCIGVVMAAETFNTSIESMARAVDRNHNSNLGRALDMASGAVLILSITAAIVGLLIFIPSLQRVWP